jgi:predicted pyridoxine 5'-phosphate oxidase superfamily flavin-nucleotide-binding protein
VNGRATLTTDPDLLDSCAVENRTPKLALLVEIEEVFTHCSKAFLRSGLWDVAGFVDQSLLPSGGQIMASLGVVADPQRYDAERAERYARREGFY